MNKLYDQERTVLELDAQHVLNYMNILVITTISLLLTNWLSGEFIIQTISGKIVLSIITLMISSLAFITLLGNFKEIKLRITQL